MSSIPDLINVGQSVSDSTVPTTSATRETVASQQSYEPVQGNQIDAISEDLLK